MVKRLVDYFYRSSLTMDVISIQILMLSNLICYEIIVIIESLN